MHISQIEPKTAENILATGLPDEWYSNNIARAACALLVSGKGNYEYGGQWTSGTTWWIAPDDTTLSVNAEGEINA